MVNGFNISASLSPNGERIAADASAKLSSSAAPLRYPQKSIGKNDDYLEIGVIKYVPPGFGTDEDKQNLRAPTGTEVNSKQKAEKTIQLPIPSNIGDTNQVNWGDDSLNSLALFGADQINKVLESRNIVGGVGELLNNVLGAGREVLIRGGAQEAIKQSFTSALVNSLGGNTTPQGLISRATGNVLNPNIK